jgi:hypothetical protein
MHLATRPCGRRGSRGRRSFTGVDGITQRTGTFPLACDLLAPLRNESGEGDPSL